MDLSSSKRSDFTNLQFLMIALVESCRSTIAQRPFELSPLKETVLSPPSIHNESSVADALTRIFIEGTSVLDPWKPHMTEESLILSPIVPLRVIFLSIINEL